MRLEGRRTARNEGRADLGDAVGERELEVGNEELPDVGATDVVGLLNLNNTEDLQGRPLVRDWNLVTVWVCTHVDRPEAGTVACSHILIEGLDGIRTSELPELLVHVVGAGARIITEPDAEVLDLQRLLLVDLKRFNAAQRDAERCS